MMNRRVRKNGRMRKVGKKRKDRRLRMDGRVKRRVGRRQDGGGRMGVVV